MSLIGLFETDSYTGSETQQAITGIQHITTCIKQCLQHTELPERKATTNRALVLLKRKLLLWQHIQAANG
jgi:hypothetical protein